MNPKHRATSAAACGHAALRVRRSGVHSVGVDLRSTRGRPMAAPTKGSETPCDISGGMWACRPTGAVDHGGAPCRGAHGASVRVAAKGRRAADCHPTMRCTIDFACRGALYMRPCRVAFCRRLAENAGALGRIYNPPLQVQCDFPPHSWGSMSPSTRAA